MPSNFSPSPWGSLHLNIRSDGDEECRDDDRGGGQRWRCWTRAPTWPLRCGGVGYQFQPSWANTYSRYWKLNHDICHLSLFFP
jgi:hypothetical protein